VRAPPGGLPATMGAVISPQEQEAMLYDAVAAVEAEVAGNHEEATALFLELGRRYASAVLPALGGAVGANADANRISMHLRKGTPERQKRLAAAAAASVTVDTAAVVDNDRKSNNGHNSCGGQRRSKTPTRPTQGPPRFPKAKPLEPGSPRPSRRTDWLEQHHQARGIILHTVPTRQAKLRQQTPGPGTAQQQDVVADDPVLLKKRKERLAKARGHSSNGFNNTRIPKPAARGRPATPQRVTKRAMDHSVDEAPAPRPQTPLGRRRQAAIESMLASGSKGGVDHRAIKRSTFMG